MGFFENLFRARRDSSADVAKKRLLMVLVDDRYKLTPELEEQMKAEIAAVIARYLPLAEPGALEVTVERGEMSDHLKAEVPLRRVAPE